MRPSLKPICLSHHQHYWCSTVICLAFTLPILYVFPSPPPDWFLCALCHPDVDEWCLPLWRQVNTSFCFIFRCVMPCGIVGFYIFLRKHSLTSSLLIAPLIRTLSSHSLCVLCAYVRSSIVVPLCLCRVVTSCSTAQWAGLSGCYAGIMMTKNHLSELRLFQKAISHWMVNQVGGVEGCRIKGFSSFFFFNVKYPFVKAGEIISPWERETLELLDFKEVCVVE